MCLEWERGSQRQTKRERGRETQRQTEMYWHAVGESRDAVMTHTVHKASSTPSLCWYTIAEVEDHCYRYLTSTTAPCFTNTGSYKWFQYFQTQQCYRVHHGFALFIQYYLQEPLTMFPVFLIPSSGFTFSFLSILSAISTVMNKQTQKQAPSLKSMLQATFLHACSQIGLKTIVDIREEVH